jgi:hypothetical protein
MKKYSFSFLCSCAIRFTVISILAVSHQNISYTKFGTFLFRASEDNTLLLSSMSDEVMLRRKKASSTREFAGDDTKTKTLRPLDIEGILVNIFEVLVVCVLNRTIKSNVSLSFRSHLLVSNGFVEGILSFEAGVPRVEQLRSLTRRAVFRARKIQPV